jgi:protein-disulfide isomerase
MCFILVLPSISHGNDISLGSTKAPVNIIEYGSLTCDYCIDFHKNILPEIIEEYIVEGKVSFTYRHYPTSESALEGAVAADCSGDKFYEMLEFLYNNVSAWYAASNRQSVFEKQSSSIGVNLESFRNCIVSAKSKQRVLSEQRIASDKYQVLGTPTFFINGEIVRGKKTFEDMRHLIESAIQSSQ